MQTLVYSTPYTDDRIDLRRMVGKDQEMSESEAAEKSDYVLFAPGSILAPVAFRSKGRTSVTVTDEVADELRTHPIWHFRTQEDHDAHDARTRKRAADQLGPVVAERVMAGLATGAISPAVLSGDSETDTAPEIADAAPMDPAAVLAAAKAQATADRQTEKEAAKAEKDAAKAEKEAPTDATA